MVELRRWGLISVVSALEMRMRIGVLLPLSYTLSEIVSSPTNMGPLFTLALSFTLSLTLILTLTSNHVPNPKLVFIQPRLWQPNSDLDRYRNSWII